jgi:predicted TIM-barrel fold metal-dependent hydrolase
VIIDAHAHTFPAVSGVTGLGETRGEGPLVRWGDGSVMRLLPPSLRDGSFPPDLLVEYMDWVGVDRAVLIQGPFYGPLNDYVSGALDRFPDRFMGCGMIDPLASGASRVYDRVVGQLGLRNLKFECSVLYGLAGVHGGFDYLDPRWQQIWERINEDGLTVVIDTGLPGTVSFNVSRLAEVAERYPRCRLVIAHLGFPPSPQAGPEARTLWEPVVNLGRLPNVWFDLAGLMRIDGDDYPCHAGQAYVREAVEAFGADRLMWGTDMPGMLSHLTYRQALDFVAVKCSFLSPSQRAQILGESAARVFQERAKARG